MRTLKIAVTGGIGSGKSYATNVLKATGINVISCDEIGKTLLTDKAVIDKLADRFPFAIVDGSVDKKALAESVFNDKSALEYLNNLMHTEIMKRAMELAEKNGGVNIIEVPLLFEGGYQSLFDEVIVITRPLEDRIQSVIERSNLTEQQIRDRIKNQIDYDNFDLSSYTVIQNNGKDFASSVINTVNELIQKKIN